MNGQQRLILQKFIEPCYVLSSEHCPRGICFLETIMREENEVGNKSYH